MRHALTRVDAAVGAMQSLQTLMLAHNKLQVLPEELAQCTSLKELQVQHNDLHRLPESASDMHNLEVLQVEHNRLEYMPPEVRKPPRVGIRTSA